MCTERGPGSSSAPRLSVIVPVHQGASVLPRSLAALSGSDLPRAQWELIVVDDASTDRTAEIAREYADTVLRLAGTALGPAHARNRGAAVARGEYLVFVDADVCVHPDALRRFAEVLASDPNVAAVFGAYDTTPCDPGLISQYRNLLHHYFHVRHVGETETFWAGCGAIRRHVFGEVGGFDDRAYRRPQIEDIELGYRLRDAGHRILLQPAIQGTHLKRWTLGQMIVIDLRDRGIPWVLLRLREGKPRRPETLNLRPAEKLYTALTGAAGLLVSVAIVEWDARWLLAGAGLLGLVLAGNLPLLRWLARERGFRFAVAVLPLRTLYYALNVVAVAVGWARHQVVGPSWPSDTEVVRPASDEERPD